MGMSSSSSDDLNSDINVTPFVDVMLVLLVIFMVTAPLLNTGVNIDLPQSQNVVENDPEGKLTLSIDMKPCPQPKPGCFVAPIFLGKLPIRWTELGEKLLLNPRVQNEKELFIEADKDLPYSVVVKAMAVAQANGVAKLQMRTDMSPTIDLSEMDKPQGTDGDSR